MVQFSGFYLNYFYLRLFVLRLILPAVHTGPVSFYSRLHLPFFLVYILVSLLCLSLPSAVRVRIFFRVIYVHADVIISCCISFVDGSLPFPSSAVFPALTSFGYIWTSVRQ
jgi:hypothetical protein